MIALGSRFGRLASGIPDWVVPTVVIVLLSVVPFVSPSRIVQLTILFGINALLAQSINILTGYAGQISLGQAAVYGAGAYGTGVLAVNFGWPVWASAPAGLALALLVGAAVSIPAGRVRELYLAVVTLGLGLLAFQVMRQWTDVTGGFSGLSEIPSPPLNSLVVGGYSVGLVTYYYFALILITVLTWLVASVVKSHIGRSFVAVQENELAASTLGVDPARRKRLAYMFSAGLAGIAGVAYAHLVGFISPDAFSVNTSIAILVFAVLGGMRTIAGPFLGAALLTYLPDQLQAVSQYQQIIYGLVLLFSFIVLPRGIAGMLPYRTPLIRKSGGRANEDASVHEDSGQIVPPWVGRKEMSDATAEPNYLLELHDITQSFTGVRALDTVSMSVRRGSIHGLIGPNGSGKSTLLNVVSGIYIPESGSVVFDGREVKGKKPHQVANLGISRTFQHPLVFEDLTVLENVVVGAERLFRSRLIALMLRTRGATLEERRLVRSAEEAIKRVGLAELGETLAGALPFGRKRMLELARSLCAQPQLLMLDEPAAGLAEDDLVDLARVLQALSDQGMTILLIEHHMDFLLKLADSVTILDHGSVIFHGDPSAARRDERVLEAYLGKSAATMEA